MKSKFEKGLAVAAPIAVVLAAAYVFAAPFTQPH